MPASFCTLFTRNTLAAARCLAESVRAAHPEARVFGLLVDRPDEALRAASLPFELVELPALALPDLHGMLFRYSALEMCCACKPYLLTHLLERRGCDRLVYLDADVLVLSRLDAAFEALERSAVLLTPHTLTPLPADGRTPGEDRLLTSGAFNAGFVAVTGGARRFLDWWAGPLARDCGIDPARGRYLDQKLLDLAPARFPEVGVLRDPGYNVAYWNLHERPVTRDGARFLAAGRPLACFHFSGFDPAVPDAPSRHQDRFRMDQLGAGAELFALYRSRLAAHDHARERTRPYAFGLYDDGRPVPEVVRRCFRRCGDAWRAPQSPFDGEGPFAFRHWCLRPDHGGLAPVLHEVLAMRPDVRAAYPDPAGLDRDALHQWLRHHGAEDFGLTFPAPRAAAPAADGPPGFNVLGFLRSEKGLGRAARAVLGALAAAGVPHARNDWFDPGSQNLAGLEHPSSRAQPHPVNLLLINAVGIPEVDHYFPGYQDGRLNIGYWNWELEWFPEAWRRSFETLSEVWAPSRFVARAVAALSPVPVRVVPYAVEPLPGAGAFPRAHFGLPEGRFAFLTACDLSSCLARKNPLGAIRAFRRAFGRRRDVVLLVKVLGAAHRPADLAAVVAACGGQPNIRLLDRVLDDRELGALYDVTDAYVSLHRSEGFGFPVAEAMAAGKPVIATAYSSTLDFMSEEDSLLVPHRRIALEEEWGPYPRGALWADPDEEVAAEHMRALVADPALGARLGDRARARVAAELSLARVGALLDAQLTRLDGRTRPAAARRG